MTLAAILPLQVPLINGTAYSFGHIELDIAGLQFTGGFVSIDYDRDRDREMVYSNSPDPVAKTLGENKYTGEAEVFVAWWLALLNTIQAVLGPGYGDQMFTTKVSYNASPGLGPPFQDVLLGCNFDSTKAPNKRGTAALTRTIKLSPLKILYNGVDDLANPLQALPL